MREHVSEKKKKKVKANESEKCYLSSLLPDNLALIIVTTFLVRVAERLR